MSVHVDQRPVLERLEDLVDAAAWDLEHPDDPVARCACGASLRVHLVGSFVVCAGCGFPPVSASGIRPGAECAVGVGDGERGVPRETSAVDISARKGVPAVAFASWAACGVLGLVGWALRSLKLRVLGGVR